MKKLSIGDKVKLTGKFLKSTGQGRGSAGLDTWTVTGFCGRDNHLVVTNERMPDSHTALFYTTEELEREPHLRYRIINAANLYKVGTITSENCP